MEREAQTTDQERIEMERVKVTFELTTYHFFFANVRKRIGCDSVQCDKSLQSGERENSQHDWQMWMGFHVREMYAVGFFLW